MALWKTYCWARIVLPVPGGPLSRVITLSGSPPPRIESSRDEPLESRSLIGRSRFDAEMRWCPTGPGRSRRTAGVARASAGTRLRPPPGPHLRSDGRDGEDRQGAGRADVPAHLQPDAAGDHQVDDQKIRGSVGKDPGDVIAVEHDGGDIALGPQEVLGEVGGVRVTLGEQDRQRGVIQQSVAVAAGCGLVDVRGACPPALGQQPMRIRRL